MHSCDHCGTPFSASIPGERFCCRGCEFVHGMIHEEGFDRYYELSSGSPGRPARSLPFEARDFAWLSAAISAAEQGKAPGSRAEADLSIDGISCAGCVWLIGALFSRQAGALEASANPATGRIHLSWRAGELDGPAAARGLQSFGYALVPLRAGGKTGEARSLGVRFGLCAAFAMNAMGFTLPRYLGMPDTFAFSGIFELVAFLSATLAMLVGGSYFIQRAWNACRAGILHIDLPIALGLVLAFCGSIAGWALGMKSLIYFDFVATFSFLMLGGRYLQLSALERNRLRLQRHRPVAETLESPDATEPVALADIVPGTRIMIPAGQALPVPAVVDGGACDFSLEWINGEADPVTFQAGRTVPAGAIHLGTSPALLVAAGLWKDSLLARLTGSERGPVRVPALERLLRIYLLAVLVAGLTAFVWWARHGGWEPALQVAISVFVVSCPCALGVALPLADELAGAAMERAGVFVRENLLWGRLMRVRKIIFDKTGTLTLERPVLVNPEVLATLDGAARLALARLTADSPHPVSRTLIESLGAAGQRQLRENAEVEVIDVPGTGRHYEHAGARWSLGRPAADSHDAELACDGRLVAAFRFRDSLRPDARAAVAELKAMGLRPVILSGDRAEKVAQAAAELGIPPEDAHAVLQPEEKEARVRYLDEHDTLYLGDGANDSLAFNAAWVTGTPVVDRSVLEGKSDFYFMGSGLRFLPHLLHLARCRSRAVRTAFGFALAYNLTVVGIAVAGHMNPLWAAVLMPGSSAISLAIVSLGLKGKGHESVVATREQGYGLSGRNRKKVEGHERRAENLRARSL